MVFNSPIRLTFTLMIFLGFSLNAILLTGSVELVQKKNSDVSELIEKTFLAVEIGGMDNFTWYIIHI